MNRRLFHRVNIAANGELLWTTRSRLGRVKHHSEYISTINVSTDGAKIVVPGQTDFAIGSRARLKLGIEFCDVDVLESVRSGAGTALRVTFVNPSPRFVAVVERWGSTTNAADQDDFNSNRV